jgi:hypothetical protein
MAIEDLRILQFYTLLLDNLILHFLSLAYFLSHCQLPAC